MKIGQRLYLGFIAIVVISLIIGSLNYLNFKHIRQATDEAINNRYPKVKICLEIKQLITENVVGTRDIILHTDAKDIQAAKDLMLEGSKKITPKYAYLDSTVKTPEGVALLNEIKEARKGFVAVRAKVMQEAEANNNVVALSILDHELVPAQNAYFAIIDKFMDMQSEKMKSDSNSVFEKVDSSILWIIILLAISVALSLIIAYYITKSITKPINQAVLAADALSNGDFNVDLNTDKKDETGMLLGALKKMSGTIEHMVVDINSLAHDAIEGKLDKRADANKYSGQYSELVTGINQTLDAIITPLNMTAEYVDRISKGDMPPVITEIYRGDFNEIKTNINALIDSTTIATNIAVNISKGNLNNEITLRSSNDELMKALQIMTSAIKALVEDASMLTKAAEEGKLSTRADASKHGGDFAEIVSGINSTLDNIVRPLNMAADYMEKIAKGAIPEQITETYNGDFNGIKNSLNSCIDTLGIILRGIARISNSMKNGNLKDKGNLALFQPGDWRNMFQGINDIIEALVNPINLTSDYVSRISRGDIPEKITEVYYGEFNTTKNNLNTCIDAINNLVADANMLAQSAVSGELSTRADVNKHQGDFKKIVMGVNNTLDSILAPINEAVEILKEMSEGDLSLTMQGEYLGDHAILKNAVNKTLDSLNELLSQVAVTTDEVNRGSLQVSDASTALSQGATEQAASLEEITSSMSEVGSQTRENAENANQANTLTYEAKEAAEKGNKEMGQLNKAMDEISESSKNISKIIRVIDEIAFQTNLLALNAAVEAARAGRHGKGFAVVAEEVRNLAARSASAAKETSTLIEDSIKSVETGGLLAKRTSEALEDIKNGSIKAADIVGEIATLSNEQAQSISQINEGLNQIDKVTQTNTASAEQSASASEELSGQANQLKIMLSKFKLREITAKQYPDSLSSSHDPFAISLAESSQYRPKKRALTQKNEVKSELSPKDYINLDEDDFDRY